MKRKSSAARAFRNVINEIFMPMLDYEIEIGVRGERMSYANQRKFASLMNGAIERATNKLTHEFDRREKEYSEKIKKAAKT